MKWNRNDQIQCQIIIAKYTCTNCTLQLITISYVSAGTNSAVCLSTKCLKQRLYGKDPTLKTKINLLPALETVDCDFYRKNLCHVLEVSRFNSKVSAAYLRMFGLNLQLFTSECLTKTITFCFYKKRSVFICSTNFFRKNIICKTTSTLRLWQV